MSDGYTPRAGSVAHQVIEYLQTLVDGASVSAEDLEKKLKVQGVPVSVRKCVSEGLLRLERVNGKKCYSLPAPPPPSDGRLQIGAWSDGDVVVQGGVQNVDGSTTYTRAQLQQLIEHVTTPYLALVDMVRPLVTG